MSKPPLSCASLCQVIDRLEMGIIVLDRQQNIVHWNRWLSQRSEIVGEEVWGKSLYFAFPNALGSRLAQAVEQAISHGLPALLSPALNGALLPLYQSRNERRQQRRMQQLIHVLPLHDAHSQGACVIQITDMTANVSRERLLRQQAENLKRSTSEDPLTGLLNRRCFDELLANEFRKAQSHQTPIALLVADVDDFSQYNAHYGRDLGDETLKEIAKIFRAAHRQSQDVLCRYGGEEFAFILPGMNAGDACNFAENLRVAVLSRAISHETSTVARQLTVSIGLTLMVPDSQSDTHTLVSSADVALYQAKHEGRNRSVFFSVETGQFRTCG